jgi:hypothetical protein
LIFIPAFVVVFMFVVSSFLPSGQTLRLQRVCQGPTNDERGDFCGSAIGRYD